ncbi:hypothetical protein U1Q18_031269 [Sarracenia purpurea var. burkii]
MTSRRRTILADRGLPRGDGLSVLILSLLPLVRRRNHWYLGFGGFTGCPPRRCGLLDPYDFSTFPPCPVMTLFLEGTGEVGVISGALEVTRLGLSPSSDSRETREPSPGLLVVPSGGIS